MTLYKIIIIARSARGAGRKEEVRLWSGWANAPSEPCTPKRKTGKSVTITFALTWPGFDAVCSYGGASREITAESRLMPNCLQETNLAGGSLLRAWPKHFEGPVPRVGMSKEWACPKSGPVPRVGLSQEWACPKNGLIPRACPKGNPKPHMKSARRPQAAYEITEQKTHKNICGWAAKHLEQDKQRPTSTVEPLLCVTQVP